VGDEGEDAFPDMPVAMLEVPDRLDTENTGLVVDDQQDAALQDCLSDDYLTVG